MGFLLPVLSHADLSDDFAALSFEFGYFGPAGRQLAFELICAVFQIDRVPELVDGACARALVAAHR